MGFKYLRYETKSDRDLSDHPCKNEIQMISRKVVPHHLIIFLLTVRLSAGGFNVENVIFM